jgi:mannose-1-phosphate guanylyltransferase
MVIGIMAGGSGTRFWPASRETLPKQFLPIQGSKPLVYETYRRVATMVRDEHIFLVINRKHRPLVDQIFNQHPVRIIEEPEGKNTAPCIGLLSLWVEREFGDQPLAVLPSDHYIGHEEIFRKALCSGLSFAKEGGIVMLGSVPTYPETGYGYVEKGREIPCLLEMPVYEAKRFIEKPDIDRARSCLVSRSFFWNMGIFIFKPSVILSEMKRHLPELAEGLLKIGSSMGSDGYGSVIEEVYSSLSPTSIDYGIMERTSEKIYLIPGEYGWSDVGSWNALFKIKEQERDSYGNLVQGNAILLDTENSLVYSKNQRLIGVLGLKDALIVDTEDVLLISNLHRSQELRQFPEILGRRGWKQWM